MERPIGETFEYEGVMLKVVKKKKGCEGCYFYKSACMRDFLKIGNCSIRDDKKSVIFQEVKANANANADATAAAQSSLLTAQSSLLTAHSSIPISTPVSMTEEQKQKALQSLPHDSIQAFSKLYANFIADCEQMGIRVCGVEFYAERRER